MRNQKLFAAVLYFPLADAGGDFLERLCREHHWPLVFGKRAIDEYKRFVYLTMVAPMPLTPSDDVDRVWRLHLLYERSYAQMGRVLPRPLAYKPLNGGDWYERTKSFYQREFGVRPPKHLWSSRPVASDHIAGGPIPLVLGFAAGAAAGAFLGWRAPVDLGWLSLACVALALVLAVQAAVTGRTESLEDHGHSSYQPPMTFFHGE